MSVFVELFVKLPLIFAVPIVVFSVVVISTSSATVTFEIFAVVDVDFKFFNSAFAIETEFSTSRFVSPFTVNLFEISVFVELFVKLPLIFAVPIVVFSVVVISTSSATDKPSTIEIFESFFKLLLKFEFEIVVVSVVVI